MPSIIQKSYRLFNLRSEITKFYSLLIFSSTFAPVSPQFLRLSRTRLINCKRHVGPKWTKVRPFRPKQHYHTILSILSHFFFEQSHEPFPESCDCLASCDSVHSTADCISWKYGLWEYYTKCFFDSWRQRYDCCNYGQYCRSRLWHSRLDQGESILLPWWTFERCPQTMEEIRSSSIPRLKWLSALSQQWGISQLRACFILLEKADQINTFLIRAQNVGNCLTERHFCWYW